MEAGKGTMGKLMKDEAMYNNLTKASKEIELLLQDLRLHPTRYVNVSAFRKKREALCGANNSNRTTKEITPTLN